MTPMKKKTSKKTTEQKAPPKTRIEDIAPEEQIVGAPLLGKVRRYDETTREMALLLETALSVGDGVRVKGLHTDLIQRVEFIRAGKRSVQSALPGESVRVEVADCVQVGDAVYKVRAS